MDPEYEEAVHFYKRNYRALFTYTQQGSDDRRTILGTPGSQHCRFCGRHFPEVRFRLKAHAVPECIGNKKLFSRYECDACNRYFGSGIENDFGNWSKPMRTLTGRRGKSGVPTLKGGGEVGWRIERENNQLSVNAGEEAGRPFVASEDHRMITFDLQCDPYVPMGVLKTFVKMGLSIMPEEEMPNFRKALAWLMNPVHQEDVTVLAPVAITFTPGSMPTDMLTVGVISRKHDAPDPVPYAFLLLSFGNFSFQVVLPSPEQDQRFDCEASLLLKRFPWSPSPDGPLRTEDVDLFDAEPVTDARTQCTFQFETVIVSGPRLADSLE